MTKPEEPLSDNDEERANKIVERWLNGYRRGRLRFFILHKIYHHNKTLDTFYGYTLAKDISKLTDGEWEPTTASIYAILGQMSDEGIIEVVREDKKYDRGRPTKKYRLTPFGRLVAEKFIQKSREFARNIPHSPFIRIEIKQYHRKLKNSFKLHSTEDLLLKRKRVEDNINRLLEIKKILDEEIKSRKIENDSTITKTTQKNS